MQKQLITKQFVINEVHYKSGCSILLMGLGFSAAFSYVIFCLLIKGFDLPINLITLGISLFAGVAIFILYIILSKHSNKKAINNEKEYYIVEDVLLSKRSELAFKRGMRLAITFSSLARYEKAYYLKFLRSGEYRLPSKDYNQYYFKDCEIYDFAQREDRFYVLVNSYGEIKNIFDVRLFDISLDDFEQIEYKYYPKKDKLEQRIKNEK